MLDHLSILQGKTLAEAKGEIGYGAGFVEWFADEGRRAWGETIPSPAASKRLITIKQPIGVAGMITPVSSLLYFSIKESSSLYA